MNKKTEELSRSRATFHVNKLIEILEDVWLLLHERWCLLTLLLLLLLLFSVLMDSFAMTENDRGAFFTQFRNGHQFRLRIPERKTMVVS